MPKKSKPRASLEEVLAACSETLFPADLGDAPVTLHTRGVEGDTPLHVMLWRGNSYAVSELIKAGADVNAAGDMSETPLHVAIRKQNIAAVEAMLKLGADPSRLSAFGQSPRDLAKEVGGDVQSLLS